MTPEKQQLTQLRLHKAKDTLREVHILMDNALWNIAVNRLYYACFYAVSALLECRDVHTKTHGGAQQMFGLHFLKTGIIKEETGDFFSTLFRMRQSADYEFLTDYEKEDVQPLIQPALDLVAEIEQFLSGQTKS
ncbi:MAG: hypothetical protein K0Q79_1193 [Flavipsychrobacter sp.]|jgi:uncharacterized protein (UPF0332 family)|nr:hypothetical protein [Flavipsychrobacter sp.]